MGVIVAADLKSIFVIFPLQHFFISWKISKIRSLLPQSNSEKLIHAFISSQLDYCSEIFAELTTHVLNKLHLIQNAAAKILTETKTNVNPSLGF